MLKERGIVVASASNVRTCGGGQHGCGRHGSGQRAAARGGAWAAAGQQGAAAGGAWAAAQVAAREVVPQVRLQRRWQDGSIDGSVEALRKQ
ncbi:unnamed protein product [Closterium sp. Naga37s-1]|nr:unnamed protein product [Closterium sp. Naga37s-1]